MLHRPLVLPVLDKRSQCMHYAPDARQEMRKGLGVEGVSFLPVYL